MLIFMRLMKLLRYILGVSFTASLFLGSNIYFYFSMQVVALANQKLLGIPSVSATYITTILLFKPSFVQRIHPGLLYLLCYELTTHVLAGKD